MVLALVYVLFLLYAILRLFRRPTRTEEDYIVAGRRLTLPGFVVTLVATWYGGILGIGEYTWRYGLSNWLVFGVPYYLAAGCFAVFLAGRARRSLALTIPDQLERHYGRPAALVGAAVLTVMTAPAPYVLMLGILVQLATGWPLWLGVLLGTFLSVGYVYRGGLRAVVATDAVQFILMYVAFLVLVPACVARYGGWSFLAQNLPAGHLLWDGGRGWQAILVWYFIALVTLVEPTFYQRCYAARSASTARRGIWVSILFWLVFDLLTTTAGLYARAVLPDLAEPVAAFPSLAQQTLSPFWQGLFFVGLLATIMSTVDSYAFICAVTIGRDIVQRWRAPADADLQTSVAVEAVPSSLPLIRISLVLTAILTMALAMWARSVILLWHHVGSVVTPVLLLPLALSHTSHRAPARLTLAAMCGAGFVSLAWLAAGRGEPFLQVEAIFPGLAVSSLLLLPALRRG